LFACVDTQTKFSPTKEKTFSVVREVMPWQGNVTKTLLNFIINSVLF